MELIVEEIKGIFFKYALVNKNINVYAKVYNSIWLNAKVGKDMEKYAKNV